MTIWILMHLFILNVISTWVPKIVWTYWEDPIKQDDHLYRSFTENHKRFLDNTGWQYRFLNKQTVKHWINNMKETMQALQRPQFKNQHVTKRANLIRLSLLKQYGGVWIDYTTFFVNNLDWLTKLKQIPIVQGINGNQPNVVMTYHSFQRPPIKAFDPIMKRFFLTELRIQTSFIVAKPKSQLLVDWLNFFVQSKRVGYDKQQAHMPLNGQSYVNDIAFKQNVFTGSFGGKYFQFQISLLIVIQRKQRQFDNIWQRNGKNRQRQFAVSYYNFWVLPFQKSIFFSSSITQPKQISITQYLIRLDQDQIKQQSLDIVYPVKLVGSSRFKIFQYLELYAQKKSSCRQLRFIHTNSLLYKYLIKNYPVDFIKNIKLDKYSAKLNIGLFCPELMFQQNRRIVIEYTNNWLNSEINKIFQNLFFSYYVEIEVNDQSTLGLYGKGWNGISVSSHSVQNNSLYARQQIKNLKLIIQQPNNPTAPKLKKICQTQYDQRPTFLNIGEKGMELMILFTNDWKNLKCRPDVIMVMDIGIQANYLQHEALLTQNNYKLLKHYKINQNKTIGHIFVEKKKYEHYYRCYKFTQSKYQKQIGVVKFQIIKKIIENYFFNNNNQNGIIFNGQISYYFSRVGQPLVISEIFDKRSSQKQGEIPVFVLNFDPLNSEILVLGEFNKSTIQVGYLRFLKLSVQINLKIFSVFILNTNSPSMSRIIIKTIRLQQISQKEDEVQSQNINNYSIFLKENQVQKIFIKQSIQLYGKLSQRVIIYDWIIVFLILIILVCILSLPKNKQGLNQNQPLKNINGTKQQENTQLKQNV